MTLLHADWAWLGGDRVSPRVLIEVRGERIASVRADVEPPAGAERLAGVTLPGLANAHSHAFQRALRGRSQRSAGSFWTWREDMYALAARLTPDSYLELARATYAEMALAGIACVGEFHYVHHDAGGARLAEPNAFGEALVAAASQAGVRVTLLDACYLAGGFDEPLRGAQRRFGDRDALAWAARVGELRETAGARIGAAIHSVRAVPAEQIETVVGWARERAAPLHFHLSEQPAENEACLAAHGRTPAELLGERGALGPGSCAVHVTHPSVRDIALLGGSATALCMCPTTERDLADGIGPARALAKAGSPLCLGSDSHAAIDLLEEARAVEHGERLRSGRRGAWDAAGLLRAATADGYAALGWPRGGRIEPGALADLTTIALDSVRLAGADEETMLESIVFAAAAPDVRELVVGGRRVVAGGRHLLVDDVPRALRTAIAKVAPGAAPAAGRSAPRLVDHFEPRSRR